MAGGHQIRRVFFHSDGVYAGNVLNTPPQDEEDMTANWRRFAEENQVELVICIASALKRGVLAASEANRYDKPVANIAPGFVVAGLGQLVEAILSSDRLIIFGP